MPGTTALLPSRRRERDPHKSVGGGGRGRSRGLGVGLLLPYFQPSEVGSATATFLNLVVLLAHELFFFGFLRNFAISLFAFPTRGSPWANVIVLKSRSSSRWSDFRA